MIRIQKALLLSIAATCLASAQDGWETDEAQESRLETLRRYASQMISGMRQLGDWDVHYDLITDSVERVYERNGWNSEADLFSLEMMRDVSAIPPWEIQSRFDRAVEVLSDRYFLNERQENYMRRILLRENNALFMRHSDRIMTYAMEAIQTRAAGEPFTPDQVARWAELAMPVFMDSQRTMQKSVVEFSEILDPEQKELLDADFGAANRRMQDMNELGQQWLAGGWRPEDWGLEEDPIQTGALKAYDAELQAAEAASASGENPQPTGQPEDYDVEPAPGPTPQRGVRDGDSPPEAEPKRDPRVPPGVTPEDAWARYVRDFIAKYKLNEEQQQHAWLFHKASTERADAVRARFERVTKDVAAGEKMNELTQQRDRDVERLFDALKGRLERLPTRAQRRAAETP